MRCTGDWSKMLGCVGEIDLSFVARSACGTFGREHLSVQGTRRPGIWVGVTSAKFGSLLDDMGPHKWCPLCREWKAAIVLRAETVGTELVETSRELTYCPRCGAMLLSAQS